MKNVLYYTEDWFPGDPIIWRGLKKLLQAAKVETCNGPTPTDDISGFIQPGTPSWITTTNWKHLLALDKPLYLLGIGHYHDSHETLAEEEPFERIIASGKLRLVIARDKLTYWWFQRKQFSGPLYLMPCPGLYSLSPRLRTSKKRVALDLLDPLTPGWYEHCQTDYRSRTEALVRGLRERGAEVTLSMHRELEGREEFCEWGDGLGVGPVHIFEREKEWREHYLERDVYVGPRVHGVLPMAGSGAPTYGLGIDQRHHAWEQIPFLNHADVRLGIWDPQNVLDWWDLLPVEALSRTLVDFRERSWDKWVRTLKEEL